MQITWKEDNLRYVSGESAFVGKWKVASVSYDGMTSGADKYSITIYLPGIKSQDNRKNKEEAKARVEKIINYWFTEAEK